MTEELLANAYIKGASDLLQGKIEGMPKVVVIPNNATNRDMIKAMFPNCRKLNMVLENEDGEDFEISFDITSGDGLNWNAPYNKEVGE